MKIKEYPRFFIPKDPHNTTGAIWIIDSNVKIRFKSNKYPMLSYIVKEGCRDLINIIESSELLEISEKEASLII